MEGLDFEHPFTRAGVTGDADRMSDGVDAEEVLLMEQETASGDRTLASDSRPVAAGVGEWSPWITT